MISLISLQPGCLVVRDHNSQQLAYNISASMFNGGT